MPQPTPGDVHVNRPLTNVMVMWQQALEHFIAGKVFPGVPVQKQSDLFFEFDRTFFMRSEMKERPLASESAGGGFEVAPTGTYAAKVFALHKDLDDRLRSNQDNPLNLDRSSTQYLTQQAMLKREVDWASKFMTTGIWTGSTTATDITVSPLWSASGSTPIDDILAQMDSVHEKTGYRPNRLVLSRDVWTKLQSNADFLDRIAITRDKIVKPDLLAAVLEIEKVIIGSATRVTSAEGAATDVFAFVMQKDAMLAYAAPNPSIDQPSAGYTFNWTGFLGATQDGMRMKRMRMDLKESDRIEIQGAWDHKLVAAELGVFFNNAIA